MEYLNKWKDFNENYSDRNHQHSSQILTEVVDKLQEKAKDPLVDLNFKNIPLPGVNFIFNGYSFYITLTDKKPDGYSTISIIVEVDGMTESIGAYEIGEIDEVVDLILNY